MANTSDETPLPDVSEEQEDETVASEELRSESSHTDETTVVPAHVYPGIAQSMAHPRTRHSHSYSERPSVSDTAYVRTEETERAKRAREARETRERTRVEEQELDPVYARVLVETINPWTALKISFLVSFFFGFVIIALFYSTWLVVQNYGLVDQLNALIASITTGETSTSLNLYDFIDTSRVLSLGVLLAVVNVILMSLGGFALAIFYNVTSRLVGGLTVRLSQP